MLLANALRTEHDEYILKKDRACIPRNWGDELTEPHLLHANPVTHPLTPTYIIIRLLLLIVFIAIPNMDGDRNASRL